MRKTVVLSVLLLLVLSSVAFASPEFIAKYAAVKPEIDGILDDAWAEAPVVTLTMENYEAIGGSYAFAFRWICCWRSVPSNVG